MSGLTEALAGVEAAMRDAGVELRDGEALGDILARGPFDPLAAFAASGVLLRECAAAVAALPHKHSTGPVVGALQCVALHMRAMHSGGAGDAWSAVSATLHLAGDVMAAQAVATVSAATRGALDAAAGPGRVGPFSGDGR